VSLFGQRRSEERTEARVEFLGEQDGVVEQQLKAALSREFERVPQVLKAYLAKTAFQPGAQTSVALCLNAPAADQDAIVKSVSALFGQFFAKAVHMDILFLSEDQEPDLERVCSAFYSKSA
jgi:type III secretion system (T3SS) SseB-like protein